MDEDNVRGSEVWFSFGVGIGQPEPTNRIQWAAPKGVEFDPADEELIEALIKKLVEWFYMADTVDWVIRLHLNLQGVLQRVLVETERRTGVDGQGRGISGVPQGFTVKIKRSGKVDYRLQIEYGTRYRNDVPTTCQVLGFGPVDGR